jgi:FMN phosphatase YigB (HAD superfamily)
MFITLDVWNTLITFNPDVGIERNSRLSTALGVPVDKIHSAYKHIKNKADTLANEGICYVQEIIYSEFLELLGVPQDQWKYVRAIVEESFVWCPPYIHPELPTVLKELSDDYKFGIASNNNFISGEIINNVVLQHLGVPFEFKIHSADIGFAKPHKTFMEHYKRLTRNLYTIHVGDNPICDNFVRYADRVQIVKNPAECVRFLKELLI